MPRRPQQPAESPAGGSEPGPVEQSTLSFLTDLSEQHSPLGCIALALARALDSGSTMAASANAKELKATLKELKPDDGGDEFSRLVASMSAPVRDAPPT